MEETIQFQLNGKATSLSVDSDRLLLWVLRSDLGLTGTKHGCGAGHCGACTVLIDGEPVRSCTVPVKQASGKSVVTIEGLAEGDALHPLQQAFADHDGLQCGFCTPGMIMHAYGLLRANPQPARADIIQGMENNLCRCGAHKRVIEAIEAAVEVMRGGA